MKHLLLVAAGGAIGSSLRHLVNVASLRWFGAGFPWGTLLVNLAGCFAMGVLIELIARKFGATQDVRLFVATGVLGGFTTFSAFSLDAAVLWERGAHSLAALYVGVTLAGTLAAIFAGLWLARSLA
ncbi:fluoride efflux transporter CrcB [Mesorhizobium australicum]|uniref:Fluoride-specific ion channel FluC n=1 Tax=Mesorhizobium australicum TaxID=536018 RepID=A0A1X7PD97_9HYPH|nr:fluoride efflux transporter CrcB [Mesorhizobium australicum]SMH49249.1 camphor resistance protein CrcB [Mesorhizobium australicum]